MLLDACKVPENAPIGARREGTKLQRNCAQVTRVSHRRLVSSGTSNVESRTSLYVLTPSLNLNLASPQP
jgi:hypothetical protein